VQPLAISHDTFGRLRLIDFLGTEHVTQLTGWEYLGQTWIGEASGFTECLRLESDPDVTRAVAVDLVSMPDAAVASVLAVLRLPVRAGLSLQDIVAMLGEPTETHTFVQDRVTVAFRVDCVDSYEVGCTIHEDQGLIYLTVHTNPLPPDGDP
jgi:hypothetical protein